MFFLSVFHHEFQLGQGVVFHGNGLGSGRDRFAIGCFTGIGSGRDANLVFARNGAFAAFGEGEYVFTLAIGSGSRRPTALGNKNHRSIGQVVFRPS